MISKTTAHWIVFAILILAAYAILSGVPPRIDEIHHYGRIKSIYEHNWTFDPLLAMLPGYHVAMACLARIINRSSFGVARVETFLFSLAALWGVYLALSKHGNGTDAATSLYEITFLPFVFPFIFLVYTDLFSLGCVALSILLIDRNVILSASAAGYSAYVRQTNIVWCLILPVWDYWCSRAGNGAPGNAGQRVRRAVPFILITACFTLFAVLNRGITVGMPEYNPTGKVSFGNLYLFFAVIFVTQAPLIVYNWRSYADVLRKKWILTCVLTTVFILIGLFSLRHDHPFNRPELSFFLRNQITGAADATVFSRTLYLAIGWTGAAVFFTSKFRWETDWIWVAGILIFMLSQWVVEPRYFIVPFFLWVLFTDRTHLRLRWVGIVWNIGLSACMLRLLQGGSVFM